MLKRRGGYLNFYIQASNPKLQYEADYNDETLADAIESMFFPNTENAILMWNYISVPLSYKYDISYMMDDLLILLDRMQNSESGELTIHWLPDTFRCDWKVKWDSENADIQSKWENTVGHLERILNENPDVSLLKNDFIGEWKSILGIVVEGLKSCGYHADKIKGMKQLIEQYNGINESGLLYRK